MPFAPVQASAAARQSEIGYGTAQLAVRRIVTVARVDSLGRVFYIRAR